MRDKHISLMNLLKRKQLQIILKKYPVDYDNYNVKRDFSLEIILEGIFLKIKE